MPMQRKYLKKRARLLKNAHRLPRATALVLATSYIPDSTTLNRKSSSAAPKPPPTK